MARNRQHQIPLFATSDEGSDELQNDEMLKSLTENYLGKEPTLPTRGVATTRLGDLYGADELTNILDLHKDISSRTEEKRNESQEQTEDSIPSIHDIVMQVVGEIDKEIPSLEVVQQETEYPWLTDSIREKMTKITAIASDVDGTLIGSDQLVHPTTKSSVIKAVQSSFSPLGKLKYFFPATGKTRWGALNSLGPDIANLLSQCPGVYIQGLYCIVGDEVIFEKKLPKSAIQAAEELVEKSQTSIIAYDGDDLYSTKLTQSVINLHEIYGEPLSTKIDSIAAHEPGIHKILICDDDIEKLGKVRIELEALAKENDATVTQALPTMLELLPKGCSKALGVEKVCEALGIDAKTELLALGDAENDVGMLEMSAISVSVGNGTDLAKNAADIILEETSKDGGAGIAIEVLGQL